MQLLSELIRRLSVLELVGKYDSAKDAYQDLDNIRNVDLIFLDIEMPEMTGIEFLKNFDKGPEVVIISANPGYAIEAFEFEVADYIVKPPSLPRLLKAVNKVRERLKQRNLAQKEETATENEVFIKTDKGIKKFVFDEILFVEAMENYVKIWSKEGVFISHNTMKRMKEILPDYFLQVHRSYIVNINRISLIQSNVLVIETKNGTQVIPIGKKYRDELYNRLNIK